MRFSSPMRTFYILWAGQLISQIGSGLTAFAVGIWLFEQTGSAAIFTMSGFFYLMPAALVSPLAGALVDRLQRRHVLIASDVVQAVSTAALIALVVSETIEVWHVYAVLGVGSVARAFQQPAWLATIPLLVPPQQLNRASGMGRIGQAISRVGAPVVAGSLLLTIGLGGVVFVDLLTFCVAIAVLVRLPLPELRIDAAPAITVRSVFRDVIDGGRYLLRRSGLVAFVVMISVLNFLVNFATSLTVPMALTLTDADVVGTMMSIIAAGMLLGALLFSIWKGPSRRLRFIMCMICVEGLFVIVAGLRPSLVLITVGRFGTTLCAAVVSILSAPILQTAVDTRLQGRVFAMVAFVALLLEPVAHLLAGPLADTVFEPLMIGQTYVAYIVGPVIGTGTGRGMALIFVVMGAAIVALGALGFVHPSIRKLEQAFDAASDEGR